MTDKQKIEQLLTSQTIMTLAVILGDGTPWAIPVAIRHHEGITKLEWVSKVDAIHSQAIAQNPRVAISIFEDKGAAKTGLYLSATTRLDDQKGDTGFYSAAVQRAWVNDETFQKRELELF